MNQPQNIYSCVDENILSTKLKFRNFGSKTCFRKLVTKIRNLVPQIRIAEIGKKIFQKPIHVIERVYG